MSTSADRAAILSALVRLARSENVSTYHATARVAEAVGAPLDPTRRDLHVLLARGWVETIPGRGRVVRAFVGWRLTSAGWEAALDTCVDSCTPPNGVRESARRLLGMIEGFQGFCGIDREIDYSEGRGTYDRLLAEAQVVAGWIDRCRD